MQKPRTLTAAKVPGVRGTPLPVPDYPGLQQRLKRSLTEPLGLSQFGVNFTTLEPGGISTLRHWHEESDEFVYVLDGELTLVTNAGSQVLHAGAAAGYPKGAADGHQFVNRSKAPATYLEVGTRPANEVVHYPDNDLSVVCRDGVWTFTSKDGSQLFGTFPK